ncbi:anoctamin-1 isoform X3 [Folsomia candida]|nr:anoctamin-1 isoform X3 [Folsomia candida]
MTLPEVDFVLVWDGSEDQATTDVAKERRRVFERNLEEDGLKLERERLEACNLNFVKIHAPIEVLRRYAEILKLRMPMKQLQGDFMEKLFGENEEFGFKIPQMLEMRTPENTLLSEVKSWFQIVTDYFRVDPRIFPPEDQKFTAIYSRDKEYLFDVDEKEFFTPAVRARILDFILRRKRYTEDPLDDFAFGMERLLNAYTYSAAYPLHDGDLRTAGSQRHLLSIEWASVSKCLKYQPVDAIKEYFGVKIGLYFAWLGFYTHMLIFAAGLGIICFLYGCFTLYKNQHSEDVCNPHFNFTMCPLCDTVCDYWSLHDVCFYTRLTYLFDNDATVFFAVLMSFWSAIFLECWKRYSAEITHRWDLTGFDIQEEHPREEYLIRLKHVKKHERNTVTSTTEPYVPFWKMKLPYRMFSMSMVLLLISLAVAAVVAVVTYRLAITFAINRTWRDQRDVHSWGLILVSTTAACINLVFIYFFNWLYSFLAEYLTELELHRTQTEFDDSITLKMYMLQFVNYYSSIFYIAFFKGKFVGSPAKYTKFLRKWRQEECGPGCMTELCIQLAIIMVGKQALNTVLEMIWPIAIKWFNQFKLLTGITHEKRTLFTTQWARDYKLLDWGPRSLFPEYLEMVLQYGFVTIFVAAFPLAPLFALLNNILEMRLDAKKLLVYYRRPVGQRVKDIGVWYGILDGVGKLAVISNAFIIAFTSNFIPKMVYRYGLHERDDPRWGTLNGFLEHSLAQFNTSSLELPPTGQYLRVPHDFCRYPTYRYSYDAPEELRYKRTDFYWKVWMARLAFVVVFENVVALCVMLLKWVIPDTPRKLQEQIRRENYLTNEIIIKQEMVRARGISAGGDSTAWNPVAGEKELELVRCPSNSASSRRRNVEDFNNANSGKTNEVMV